MKPASLSALRSSVLNKVYVSLSLCLIGGSISAADFQADNVEVLQNLTLRQHAIFEGSLSLGKVGPSSLPGFTVEVSQDVQHIEAVVIPAHYEQQSNYVDTYGWIDVPVTSWVEDWGWVSRLVDVPTYGDITTTYTVDPEYDENGNVTNTPGTFTSTTYGITGYTQESQTFYEVVGGHYENSGTTSVWGVTGSELQTSEVWVGDQMTAEASTTYGLPVVKFSAPHEDTAWSWRNQSRELMNVSKAGVSVPNPNEGSGASLAVFTATEFNQSYYDVPLASLAPNQISPGHGSRMTKDFVEVWQKVAKVDSSGTLTGHVTQINPAEIRIRVEDPNAQGQVETQETRIAPTTATFGGNVTVGGLLLVKPQGGLSMGSYTAGPQPSGPGQ